MALQTTNWSPGESSLARQSFNKIVQHKHFDVPEAIMWQVSMGRQAELGTNYIPPGIQARLNAERLRDRPSLEPRPKPGLTATLPRRLDSDFHASRSHRAARPSDEMLLASGGFLSWQQPLARSSSAAGTLPPLPTYRTQSALHASRSAANFHSASMGGSRSGFM
eukprot:TRINITY_DN5677_c0_g2_i1.p1 TRINITY_DN5677_c0_g2~~TRINITY_DN5677_c0_g2_i1.p1  ORF type:complete len:165 (+),score=32.56 TRINITY_DN5677_c0_g2_i1:108-602(+)